MKTCSWKILETVLQLNIQSKHLHSLMRVPRFLGALLWLSIIDLSSNSITCFHSMASVSGEKALSFKEDFTVTAL